MLVRAPGNGLNCSAVVREAQGRCGTMQAPHKELVVIATRGHFTVVGRPFQPAYLRTVLVVLMICVTVLMGGLLQ